TRSRARTSNALASIVLYARKPSFWLALLAENQNDPVLPAPPATGASRIPAPVVGGASASGLYVVNDERSAPPVKSTESEARGSTSAAARDCAEEIAQERRCREMRI